MLIEQFCIQSLNSLNLDVFNFNDSFKIIIIATYLILWQDYIARFGHGSAKLARQAQSKEKVLAKMVAGGLTEQVTADKVRVYNSLGSTVRDCAELLALYVRTYVHVYTRTF